MNKQNYSLEPIRIIRSGLTAIEHAPLQGKESAPDTWLALNAPLAQGPADRRVCDAGTRSPQPYWISLAIGLGYCYTSVTMLCH